MRSLAEEVDTDVFNGRLHRIEASSLAFGVYLMNEFIDLALVRLEPWVDIGLVDVDGALLAWHDEVEVQAETHPRVEGHPVKDKVEVRLNQQKQRECDPVHQPWRKISRVSSSDSLVRGIDGEED